MGVEGGFEAAHEGEVRPRRPQDVDGALQRCRAPRKSGRSVYGCAERKDARGGFGEMLERGRVVGIGEQCKVEDAAGAGEDGMRERSLVGDGAQPLEKWCEAGGESGDFENGGGGTSFE